MTGFGRSTAGRPRPAPIRTRTDAEERAAEAVRVFRQMLPTLDAYARAVTGRSDVKIQIVLDNGASDLNTIYFQPPIALGDKTPHDRFVCHKRNAEGFQVCPACRIRERVMAVIYHEIGHISQGTFVPYTESDVATLQRLAVPLWGGSVLKYRANSEERIGQLRLRAASSKEGKGTDYMNLLNTAHPWLPKVWNAIEDARVNSRIFAARPGVRAMYDAMIAEINAEGVPTPGTDERVLWRDCADEFQLIVGLSFKLNGFTIEDKLRWNIVTVLDDVKLNEILSKFDPSQSVRDSFEQSFAVLERFNELGFMRLPELEDPIENPKVPPPPPEEENDDESAEDDEPGPSDADDVSGDDSPDLPGEEPGGEASEEESEDEGEASGDSGDSGSDDSGSPVDQGDDGDDPEQDGGGSGSGDSTEEEDGAPSEDGDDSGDSGSDGSDESGGSSDEHSSGSGSLDGSGEPESGGSDEADDASTEQEGSGDGEDSSGEVSGEGSDRADSDVHSEGGDERSDDREHSGDENPGELSHASPEAVSEEGSRSDVLDDDSDDGREIIDTGAAGEPIEVDISADPNTSTHFADPESVHVELGEQLDPDTRTSSEVREEEKAIQLALEQGDWFTTPANGVDGVVVHTEFDSRMSVGARRRGENEVTVSANDLRRPTMQLRLIFENNRRAKMQRHMKSGKVNVKVLGKRAPLADDRLFQKKRLPGKIDYFVVIGMDLSGSTEGVNLTIEKNAIYAQAEMLNSLGIPFVIIGHSGMIADQNMHIFPIKSESDNWDEKTKNRLMNHGSQWANLDGHALEYLRKTAEKSAAVHKIILYYSDGKMPAENEREELAILQREIQLCARNGHTLIGVGVRTDSPSRHGLDTVQLDDMSDLPKVIAHLGKYLAKVVVK